jgi:hypothetical protein
MAVGLIAKTPGIFLNSARDIAGAAALPEKYSALCFAESRFADLDSPKQGGGKLSVNRQSWSSSLSSHIL